MPYVCPIVDSAEYKTACQVDSGESAERNTLNTAVAEGKRFCVLKGRLFFRGRQDIKVLSAVSAGFGRSVSWSR